MNSNKIALITGLLVSGIAGVNIIGVDSASALTATQKTTFNPGILWSTFTYQYTLNAALADLPFNDFEVKVNSLANLNQGSYAGPGAVVNSGIANVFKVQTAAPGGFANPVSFTINSVANPNVVNGVSQVTLTLGGAVIGGANANTNLLALNNVVINNNQVVFAPGTFGASDPVDLFQDTTTSGSNAHIGFGTANSNGSATINLSGTLGDLNVEPLYVGDNGTIVADVVPEPLNILGATTGLALFGTVSTALKKRKLSK